MKVLILGLAKSGTTALAYRIHDSWPQGEPLRFFFEPRRWPPEPSVRREGSALAKVLIGPQSYADYGSFAEFDKVILIVRDPRDTLISRLLYNLYEFPVATTEAEITAYADLVRRKVENPESIPLRELVALMLRLLFPQLASRHPAYPNLKTMQDFAAGGGTWQGEVEALFPDFCTLRYEAFVSEKLGELEDYLGFALPPASAVATEHRRVERSRGSGEWQRWFSPQDEADFVPAMRPYLNRWGYHLERDMGCGSIPMDTSVGYLERLRAERAKRFADNTG